MIHLLIYLIIIGAIVWIVEMALPIVDWMKLVIRLVAVIFVILLLLQYFRIY